MAKNKPMVCIKCGCETHVINIDRDHNKVCDDCHRIVNTNKGGKVRKTSCFMWVITPETSPFYSVKV